MPRRRPALPLLRRTALPVLLGLAWLAAVRPAAGQAPLFLVNDETTVREVSFKYVGDETLEPDQLLKQIATTDPSFWTELRRFLPLLSASYPPFDPIELQKDVVRLRRYYRQNGFLSPRVDYPASQLDTTSNTIHVIFTIEEGPPLIIQDVGFFGPGGGYALNQFEGGLRDDWIRFRDETTFRTGERFTDTRRILIQDQVVSWLKNRGFAFPRVEAETTIDSTYNVVDIRFQVDPGPRGTVSEIQFEGQTSVASKVLRRELPFGVGDRYDASKVTRGQRELFALNLFRLALADLPEDQPRDSTVTVRYRVREADLRYLSAQTGYAREDGVLLQSSWEHRNFLGGARLFTVSAALRSGFLAAPSAERQVTRSFNTSVSLRQPYLFSTRVSGIVSPFYLWEDDPNQDLNYREVGTRETIVYEIFPFRTVSLQHSISRALPLASSLIEDPGVYSRHQLSLSANLGWTDDYISPTRGYLVRPLLEVARSLVVPSGVQYTKAAVEGVAYLPLTEQTNLSLRLYTGYLDPSGRSADQYDPETELRFDRIRFYTGGASDVRGWSSAFLGPKSPRVSLDPGESPEIDDGLVVEYEPAGGLAKTAANIELRLPFPGLGDKWRTGVFLDAGQVYLLDREDQPDRVFPLDAVNPTGLRPGDLRYGAGFGIRYETLVGFIRLDFAFKLNPDDTDLYDAETLYRAQLLDEPLPELSFWDEFGQRFKLHLSIGQAF